VKTCAAWYRKPSYSPDQHRVNDSAIMDAAVARLEQRGWRALRLTEAEAEAGARPEADCHLNMCQGPRALEALQALELEGALMVNRPSSALGCHRHRLVRRLAGSGLDFPETIILSTAPRAEPEIKQAGWQHWPSLVWVKRGDVHAERADDVVQVPLPGLFAALRGFAARGIDRVAVQAHVVGPVIKFYGVARSRFFRYYGADRGPQGPSPEVDEERLRALAFGAAECLGLEVFGGDVAVPAPDRPVLIDLNDWPSFAPFRDEAANAIATLVHESSTIGCVS
jgi:glutathione synthase/RimK-type ligase-like ATP-grasp enzyme